MLYDDLGRFGGRFKVLLHFQWVFDEPKTQSGAPYSPCRTRQKKITAVQYNLAVELGRTVVFINPKRRRYTYGPPQQYIYREYTACTLWKRQYLCTHRPNVCRRS